MEVCDELVSCAAWDGVQTPPTQQAEYRWMVGLEARKK